MTFPYRAINGKCRQRLFLVKYQNGVENPVRAHYWSSLKIIVPIWSCERDFLLLKTVRVIFSHQGLICLFFITICIIIFPRLCFLCQLTAFCLFVNKQQRAFQYLGGDASFICKLLKNQGTDFSPFCLSVSKHFVISGCS